LADDIESFWDIPKFQCKAPPDVIFIINGENTAVHLRRDEPFTATIQDALKESRNTGRPLDAWDLRDLDGKFIDPSKTPSEYELEEGVQYHFFLTLKIGAGGNFHCKAA
jgi:hypothetical protein